MTGLEWTPQIVAVSGILVAALYFLISEKLPITVTAIGIVGALAFFEALFGGVLSHQEIFASFGSRGPLAVAMLFVVSAALIRTGALSFIVNAFVKLTGGKPFLLMLLMVIVVVVLSAFLNNTPVVIIFISIILMLCERFRLLPSKFLIPLSYASILGGTCTLIGTSTNLILSDMMVLNGRPALGFFELSVVGVPVAIIGGLFLVFIAPRLLPERKSTFISSGDVQSKTYVSELRILEGSPLAGAKTDEATVRIGKGAAILEVVRAGEKVFLTGNEDIVLQVGDEIVVDSEADQLTSLLSRKAVELRDGSDLFLSGPKDTHPIAELIVPANSKARGRRIQNTEVGLNDEITVLGVMRKQTHYAWQKAKQLRFATGDTILVQGTSNSLASLQADGDFLVVEEASRKIHYTNKAPLALGLFLAMIGAASFNFMGILPAASIAVALMFITRCITVKEGMRSLDGEVLLLIVSTIALGKSLSDTGAAGVYAHLFLAPFEGVSPRIILVALITFTALVTNFLSNNSAAALLTPIAVSMGTQLDVDPRAFLIGIAFGASACYLTPIGYQTNLLVYGPGGYKFSDFFRVGIPMTILVIGVSALLIPIFFKI
jgi:di/tricarboxylate transporter